MKLSLFTPTHRPTYLLETYHSLNLQTVTDWEWVIVPNGRNVTIPEAIWRDPRVRLVDGSAASSNVGELKRLACDAATGDVLIELDHDDLLVPGQTLATVREKFQAGAGFVYSDAAVFRFTAQPRAYQEYAYSAAHGWTNYELKVYGRRFLASACFDITPRSLAEIYYCPDHLRSWSRQAYYDAGGHNKWLSVGDDHELMIKTYLNGTKFAHTGGCHYLYRVHDKNTVAERNQTIQQITGQLRDSYLPRLIQAWLTRTGYAALDLTQLRRTGWNPDKHLLQGFGADQYGHIIAKAELQWFSGSQVREFMNEAYKALVPGGYLTIIVPDAQSGAGYADVEWRSRFSAMSMYPYTRRAATGNNKVQCRFQQINCTDDYLSDWHRESGFKYLRFELVALKGQRHPGLQHI